MKQAVILVTRGIGVEVVRGICLAKCPGCSRPGYTHFDIIRGAGVIFPGNGDIAGIICFQPETRVIEGYATRRSLN